MGEIMRLLVAFAVAVAIFSSATLAAERTLNIAAYDYPPYFSKDLENGGFMTEIIVEAFKRSGHNVEIPFLPWKRALEGTKSGKHDGLFTIWYRPEREEWFVYSDPLPANELGFYKRKDQDISFKTIEDLKPYTIGVGRGYALPPGFDEASLKISEVKDDEVSLRKLHKGRVDLVLTDKILGKYIIDTRIPEAIPDLEWLEPAAHIDIQYLVISKKAPYYDAILASFNEALAAMRADGTLKSIMAEHGF
jgi:polar amino acid transport system substrate-binding protein